MVAKYGGFEFRRCPLLAARADAIGIVNLAREKYLDSVPARERQHLPPKQIAAIHYVEYLFARRELEEPPNG